jgi:hypothetical protein
MGRVLFYIFIFTFGIAYSGLTAEYYVDKNHSVASDTNTGTENQPWLSIQKAANVAVAGDTVYIKAGVYNEKVTVQNSGRPGIPITFMAYPGETPILDGTGISLSNYYGLFTADYKNYITLDGFHVRNSAEVLVRMTNGIGFVLKNCLIHTNQASETDGVWFTHVSESYIDNNEIYDTQWNAINVTSSSEVKIRYNYIHDNRLHAGINVFPKTSEPQVTYSGNDILYNRITRISPGAAIYSRYQTDNTIAYNLIYENNGPGIKFDYDRCSGSSPCEYVFQSNTKIYNNTFVNNGVNGIQIRNASNMDVKNNIFAYNDRSVYITSEANLGHIFDHNLYYGSDYSAKGPNGIYADPLFVDPINHNYELKSESLGWTASDTGGKIGAVPIPKFSQSSDPTQSQDVTVFSKLDSNLGDVQNWEPLTPSRWSIVDEAGNYCYGITTSSYTNMSGGRLGEYSLIKNKIYGNFSFKAYFKTSEDLTTNSQADFTILFGFQDSNNYYFMMFNSDPDSAQLFKVTNGSRQQIGIATGAVIMNNNYHKVEVERNQDSIKVLYDGILCIEATDSAFSIGRIGIGSYNDSFLIDDILISESITILPPVNFRIKIASN